MNEELLPIGSVVVLKGGTKKIMINGHYTAANENPDKLYDYRGCPYPEGIIYSDGVALFDTNDINEIVHQGYLNDESINFLDKISIIKENLTKR